MSHPNLKLIHNFFEAYVQGDLAGLQQVASEQIRWVFPGNNPLSGVKPGIEAVIAFFDTMGGIMGSSKVEVEKLVTGVNDGYVVECQHISTYRDEGPNLDHDWCVLWKFEGGKIVEGKHLASDQKAVDEFYMAVQHSPE